MLKNLAILLPLLGFVNAATYTVTVGIDETNGQPGLGFDPSSIRPAAGDTITFTYALPEYIKNPASTQHSATQASFDNPCTPLARGFDTGIQSTGSANANTGSSFNLLVNDTNPLWFFSSANSDCKSGMVLSVNPPLTGDQTADSFKAKAMASSGTSSSPSSPSPPQSSASPSPSNTSGSASNSGSPSPTPSTGGAASTSAQKGLIFAGVALLMGLAVVA